MFRTVKRAALLFVAAFVVCLVVGQTTAAADPGDSTPHCTSAGSYPSWCQQWSEAAGGYLKQVLTCNADDSLAVQYAGDHLGSGGTESDVLYRSDGSVLATGSGSLNDPNGWLNMTAYLPAGQRDDTTIVAPNWNNRQAWTASVSNSCAFARWLRDHGYNI